MAQSRRTGAGGGFNLPRQPPTVGFTNEKFEPRFEEKDKEGALIIVVYLPGFSKEQIRLESDASARSITIHGMRPSPEDSRFSHFNVAYNVPTYCNFDMIRTHFVGGNLIITIPKNVVSEPDVGSPKEKRIMAIQREQAPPAPHSPSDKRTISGLGSEPKKSELPGSTTKKAITIAIVGDHRKATADGENETGDERSKESAKAETGVSKGEEEKDQKGTATVVLKRNGKGERMAAGGDEDEDGDGGEDKDNKGKPSEAIGDGDIAMEMGFIEDKGQLANVGVAFLVIIALGAWLFDKLFGSFGK